MPDDAHEWMPEGERPSDRLRTLAVLLGPYRNLSTLTSAVLALHPNVQVLNHGAERLWSRAGLDFIARPTSVVFRRFMAAALDASAHGHRGDHGGSILLSHAFDDPALQALYAGRYGDARIKPEARCLVWKDSMRIQKRLAFGRAMPTTIRRFPDVKFILPIRKPLDCALSNMRTGHARHLAAKGAGVEVVLNEVLNAIAWGLEQRDRWPDRIFAFTQGEAGDGVLQRLADFLDISPDRRWIEETAKVFRVRESERHDFATEILARRAIEARLARWPDILADLSP